MSLGRSTANIALAALALVLSLIACEIGLAVFLQDAAPEPVTRDNYAFYQFDPVLGWSNSPNARGTYASYEFSHPLNINAHGLRGPEIEIPKPPGRRRIAVLGDSFTWGIGAAESELYTTLLQQAIPESEVLNFGVSGYGPVQYSLMTETVKQFAPDIVVIAFCLSNDFLDNVFWRRYDYYKPFARLDARGDVAIEGYPLPDVRLFRRSVTLGTAGWLYRHSALARLIDYFVTSHIASWLIGQRGPAISEFGTQFYMEPGSPAAREIVEVNRKLLQRMAADYRAVGVPLVVLAVPTKFEVGPNLDPKFRDSGRKALAASLDGLGITLVDPTPAYSLDDFWHRDGHWRPSGHVKAAQALSPVVRALLDRNHARPGGG